VTGFDIIFFWVARMIMMGLKFAGDVPFGEVYIHGLVRDHEGQKMSKSKGNVLDPLDIIDGVDLDTLLRKRTEGMMQPHLRKKVETATRREFPDGIPAFGADALRMTFAALATTGRDINLDLGRIEGYRNFCNKLWNAAHYVLTHLGGAADDGRIAPELSVADRWIKSRLNETIAAVEAGFDDYRLDLAALALYDFTWHEYCDWYLELTKPVLNDADASPAAKAGARQTLSDVLSALLRLLHPFMPFITEEIWLELCERLGTSSPTVMLEPWPTRESFPSDAGATEEIAWIKDVVIGVRQIRGEMNVSPARAIPLLLADASASDRERATQHASLLRPLARLEGIELLGNEPEPSGVATALVGQLRLLVPLAGVIDVAAERARLTKQRERLERDLDKATAKLANEQFVANAPTAVIQKERDRQADLSARIEALGSQLAKL
jgi:valyl-tRNA synthetase